MAKIELAAQAETDLAEIFAYIAGDDLVAAEKVLWSIEAKCRALSENPELGQRRTELQDAVRNIPVGHYVVFYRPTKAGIIVLRILHEARDIGTVL